VTGPGHSVFEASEDEDTNFCISILPKVSRTFALSIEALPPGLREPVRAAYLLCRIVDSIEDEPVLPADLRLALFDAFDLQLLDDEASVAIFEARTTPLTGEPGAAADVELCRRAGAVLRTFRRLPRTAREAIRPHVLEMSQGMRRYCERADRRGFLQIEDFADLETYCYYVAGTVGHLLTALFEQAVPDMRAELIAAARVRAVPFGMGLQMVNILKDVGRDRQRRVCFLPASLARARGVPVEEIMEPRWHSRAMGMVRQVAHRARTHLDRATEYTLLWSGPHAEPVRLFCAVPLALALATLHEIETGVHTLKDGETPKISRMLVMDVLSRTRAAVHDPDSLRAVLEGFGGNGT
jgi:farnesyl-diphosphate farnesyltransferase